MREAEISGINQQLATRGCWPDSARPGLPGYSLPLLRQPCAYALDDERDRALLHGRGVIVQGWGAGSVLVLESGQADLDVRIQGQGDRACIVLGPCMGLAGTIAVLGNDTVLAFAGSPRERIGLSADLIADHAAMYLGADGVCYGLRGTVEGANSIVIGDDCLISDQIELRGTDSHAIIALATGQVVNPPRPILVEPHVWLAQGAVILKGVTVGSGSIVGTRGLVTRTIPPFCLAAGVPARVVRDGVSWHRPYPSVAADHHWHIGPDGFAAADGPPGPQDEYQDESRAAPPPLPAGPQARAVIQAAYRSILDREPDADGLRHFLGQVRAHGLDTGLSNLMTQLLASEERRSLEQRRGNPDKA